MKLTNGMKKTPWNLDWLRQKKSAQLPRDRERPANGYRRLANGQKLSAVDRLREFPGKLRKVMRREMRDQRNLLRIERDLT